MALRAASAPARTVFAALIGVAAAAILLMMALTGLASVAGALLAAALITAVTVASLFASRAGPSFLERDEVDIGPPAPPYAVMLEHLEEPILLVSGQNPSEVGDRRYLFANAAARDLLRLQRSEGPLTTAIRDPEVLSSVENALFGEGVAYAQWQSRGVQERFWRARLIQLPMHEVFAGSRDPSHLALLTLHDETEIRRSESTRADFLANASHELRTPLASLSGFVETLRGHAKDDPEARDRFLSIMQVQAERMRRLIDDLMSLSRIELSEHIRPSGRVDLAAAVKDVIDALGPQAGERGLRIDLESIPGLRAEAIGDRDQLAQVAQNLIENAIKYTPEGGVVRVSIGVEPNALSAAGVASPQAAHLSLLTPDPVADQRYVALRVRDLGPGIARTHLPRLAERFYRVEGQKAKDRPGTGLGLAIVKHIVNRHRGGLAVESVLGEGSTFTIYVPLAEGDAASAERPNAAPVPA